MADSTVNIKLVTTANTSGADKTTDAVKKVEQATKAANSAEAQRSASAAAATTSLNALHGAQEKAAGSGRNLGNSAFIAANAFQDFAAVGLPGVTNQVGQLAQSMGIGAGLAGGLMALGVIIDKLSPHIAKFFNGFDTSKINADGLKSFVDQLGLVSTGRDRAAIAGERFKNQLAAEDAALKAQMAVIKENTALFNLRNAAAQGQAEFETQQAIEDIRAQNLPREVEAAAIAEKKLALLERQAELQKAASDQALITAQQEAAAAAAAAASAEQEAQRLEEIIKRSARLKELKEEQPRLEKEAADAQYEFMRVQSEGGSQQGYDEAKAKADAAKAAVESNKAGQAAANRGGLSDSATEGLYNDARVEAARKQRAAAEAANAIAPATRLESERAAVDAQRRDQERQRIAREATPGVYDARNLRGAMPPDPLTGLAPLPSASGLPRPMQAAPPDPLTGLAPLPGAGSFDRQPPNPLGGSEPLPPLDVKPLEEVKKSNEEANAAVLTFAQTVAAQNDELKRKLTEMETKMKNARP